MGTNLATLKLFLNRIFLFFFAILSTTANSGVPNFLLPFVSMTLVYIFIQSLKLNDVLMLKGVDIMHHFGRIQIFLCLLEEYEICKEILKLGLDSLENAFLF